MLEIATHQLRIRCLPKDLPDYISVDVTDLKVGETIKVGSLKPVAGVEFRDLPGQPVVSITEIEEEAAATPAAGAAAPAAGAAPAGDAKAAAPAAGAKAAAPAAKAAAPAKK